MLSCLFTGTVGRAPEQRLDRRLRPIATAGLEVIDAEGATVLASLIAFRPAAVAALAGLQLGDEIAIVGHASLSRWTDGDGREHAGLNVVVSRVLTLADAGVHATPQERRQWQETAAPGATGG
ncbi:MAG: single-stranded DNA-binding protein [Piscinibacter sp.]|uniref:single-stranded DNA-binding protein n=1 Tax=Piscinibacter sp. TaxID=1903157 RepID=UPI0025845F55|nr:single-stranded DNA-binding protein [Piscinibacter sp.]MCW5664029.1 single-stranded DNA-binding protein [Piscinibacter sp.]